MIMMQDLYEFVRGEPRTDGKVAGQLRSTGVRSHYATRLEAVDYKTDARLFKAAQR
jgi:hypothetical protein